MQLLIATWEAEAFTQPVGELSAALQKTVASRTILHVCIGTLIVKMSLPTLGFSCPGPQADRGDGSSIAAAKEDNNIDAAVNLAATTKRLLALIDEAAKLKGLTE